MSVQTIIHNSKGSLVDDAVHGTIKNANKFLLEKKYRLGEGFCEKDQFHNSMILEIMKTTTCELIEHINAAVENGPKECIK